MKIKEGYILREVAGNCIVIAVGDEALNFNGIITINNAGTFLWNMLVEGAEKEELLAAMTKEYDIDDKTALADIEEFLERLRKENLLDD